MSSSEIKWISTNGGRFICLPESLLPDWHGFPDEGADPLDTSHDYGRACATTGYAEVLAVGDGAGLVFGENELGGVWLGDHPPIVFEWVYANDEDAVVSALRSLPDDIPVDDVQFTVPTGSLVVFDSAFSGSDFEPQHTCTFPITPGQYSVGSAYLEPNNETALIVHRFRKA